MHTHTINHTHSTVHTHKHAYSGAHTHICHDVGGEVLKGIHGPAIIVLNVSVLARVPILTITSLSLLLLLGILRRGGKHDSISSQTHSPLTN